MADSSNNRVLVWSTTAPATNSLPGMILGQLDYTSNGTNVSSTEMSYPSYFAVAGTWVSADAVIGQLDFGSSAPDVTATNLNAPWGLRFYGNHLWVLDIGNNRVLRMPVS